MNVFARLRGSLRKTYRPIFSLCLLLVLLFLLAFLGKEGPFSSEIAAIPQGGSVLALEEWDSLCLFAYSGNTPGSGAALAVNRMTGEILSHYRFSDSGLVWAALRGDNLFALENRDNGTYLTELSLPELNLVSSRPLPVSGDSLVLFDCDGEGRFYFTTSPNSSVLNLSLPDGTSQELEGFSSISFLEITPHNTLFLFSGSSCFWGNSSAPQSLSETMGMFSPLCLLGDSYFLASFVGFVYQYGGAQLENLCSIPSPSSPLLCTMDREEHLLYAQGNTVQCASLSGEPVGNVSVQGNLLAICGSGAISEEEGAYLFTPLQFFQAPDPPPPDPSTPDPPTPDPATPAPPTPDPPTPTPEDPTPAPSAGISPSPGVSPQPSPSTPTMVEGISQEGKYLVVKKDVSKTQIISLFIPDTVKLFWPDGTEVTGEILATGMTVKGYTLVVLGDCDGTGTLSQLDVRQSQSLLLESDQVTDPYRRAADLDGDGLLTTVDLVLLSQLVNS